ncbi:MAG: response regulator transcription factor [Anaerolineales bacterium]|nr:response regulator transcription factor [Anaerolineales bacterium]
MATLTKRQREIVRLLATGDSQKEVARKLGLRHGTVRQHMMKIRERTSCRSTSEVTYRVSQEL